jgi:hypothetical protein
MRRTCSRAAMLFATFVLTVVSFPVSAAGRGQSAGQTILYGGVGRGPGSDRGTLITIDQPTGAGALVGPGAADQGVGLTGLAFDTSGDLFASTINAVVFGGSPVSTLITLDPETGAQLASIGIISLAAGTPVVINDLAVQPGTDVLFGTALNLNTGSSNLYTISKATAVATFVGDTGIVGATLAFGPDGTLYQTSAEFTAAGVFIRGFLNTLNPATAAVLSTSAPFAQAHVGGLAVRPTDGVIFASGGFDSDIYTLSLDGDQTFLGLTGFGGVGDIAFTPLPTDKNQCKAGGWRDFSFPYSFKNQGDCIQLVNTGK